MTVGEGVGNISTSSSLSYAFKAFRESFEKLEREHASMCSASYAPYIFETGKLLSRLSWSTVNALHRALAQFMELNGSEVTYVRGFSSRGISLLTAFQAASNLSSSGPENLQICS